MGGCVRDCSCMYRGSYGRGRINDPDPDCRSCGGSGYEKQSYRCHHCYDTGIIGTMGSSGEDSTSACTYCSIYDNKHGQGAARWRNK